MGSCKLSVGNRLGTVSCQPRCLPCSLSTPIRRLQVGQCVYLRLWPNSAPCIARIEEILTISAPDKVETILGVRWFYRRNDLPPAQSKEAPVCNTDREIFISGRKLDEVSCAMLLDACHVLHASQVLDVDRFLSEPDSFFYRYEYNPAYRGHDTDTGPFTLPGGLALSMAVARLRSGASPPVFAPGAMITMPLPAFNPRPRPRAPFLIDSEALKLPAGTSFASGGHASGSAGTAFSVATSPGGTLSACGVTEGSAAMIDVGSGGSAQKRVLATAVAVAVARPVSSGGGESRPGSRSRKERLQWIQAKLDRMYPPFTCVDGVTQREFDAVIPLPGERYANEGCARCMVRGCDRAGLIFHLKNLSTHASPRGGQPPKVSASRTHINALTKLLGYRPKPAPHLPTSDQPKAPTDIKEGLPPKDSELDARLEGTLTTRSPVVAVSVSGAASTGSAEDGSESKKRAPQSLTPRHHESSNFAGSDNRYIFYRGMRLPFLTGHVLLVRRVALSANPARNVKFLGNLSGAPAEWQPALRLAHGRASEAGLVLVHATRYDELHVDRPGGLDSNHCLCASQSLLRSDTRARVRRTRVRLPIVSHAAPTHGAPHVQAPV